MAKKCPNCGAEVADQAQFCPHCGFTLDQEVEETVFMQEQPAPAKPAMHGQFESTAEEGFPWGWTVGQFAGWWQRFIAWAIIDFVILGIIEVVVIGLLGFGIPILMGLISQNLVGAGTAIGWLLAFVAVFLAYYFYVIVPTGKTGQTLGKKIVKIKVVDKEGNPPGIGAAFFREVIGKAISGFVFNLGFIWAGFDNQRRAWHDRMAGTFVIPTE